MSPDYRLFLDDMKGACDKILRYTSGLTFEQFIGDDKTFDAVVRNLEILGEAAKHIPDHVRESHGSVEWRKISGLRDFIAHEYFGIDHEILWDVIEN